MNRPWLTAPIFLLSALSGCATAPLTSATPLPANAIVDRSGLETFGRIVGDARTVVYGEDSHGMQQIHEMVPELFRYLVEEKGFRVFVFEVQWGVTEGLSDFMASDRTELGPQESYWLNGAFASKPIAEMLVWIREWNRRYPKDQIQIAGYQPEQPVTDFAALRAFLDQSRLANWEELLKNVAACRAGDTTHYKTELDFITANSKFNRAGKPAFSPAERQACVEGLSALGRSMESLPSSSAKKRAELHLFSLISYFENQRKLIDTYFADPDASVAVQRQWSADAYGRGDAARYHVYRELQRERFPQAKVFHWMHNWHAFRRASETDGLDGPGGAGIPAGTKSFGQILAEKEGARLRTFATIVPCSDKCTEPAGSGEPLFAQILGNRVTVLSTRDQSYRESLALDKPKSNWANQHRFGFANVVLSRQADGIIYLPKADTVR